MTEKTEESSRGRLHTCHTKLLYLFNDCQF